MAFPESFIEELISRNDIVEVVESYVHLNKRSGSNYFGLCPFHNERTPSFSVNPSEQFYYCFGCGKGGGVINFIMEIENLSYPDAVANLAQRAGMKLPEDRYDPSAKKRSRLLALNKDAARFFYQQLSTPDGKAGVEYLRNRSISPLTANRFGLGYAPDSFQALFKAMCSLGYSEYELFDCDLIRKSSRGSFYDTFRNRLIFPIIDVRGDVIGFSGRIIGSGEPKYLNSRDTPVFNKGRNLFALNLAKKSKSGYMLLAEGNIDIVSLHQAGFDSAVASLGTSLTPEQARLISRYSKEVVLAFDNDGAGQKATQRAIQIFEKLEVKVRVLRMSGAKDPDEFLKTRGPDAFRLLLEGSEDQIDYRMNLVQSKFDLTKDDQRVSYLREATALLAELPDPVVRSIYGERAASLAGVGKDTVISEIERYRKTLLRRAGRSAEKAMRRPEQAVLPSSATARYKNPASAVAEEGIIRLLFLEPTLSSMKELPSPDEFTSEELASIYRVLLGKRRNGENVSINSLSSSLAAEEMSLFVSILQKPEQLSSSQCTMLDYIHRLEEERAASSRREDRDLRAIASDLRERKGYNQ